MRAAHCLHLDAQAEVNRERDLCEPDDGRANSEPLRRRLMARQGRLLDPARRLAQRAIQLAGSRQEQFEARELLAWIDGDAGRYEEEHEQALRLVALEPRNASSWLFLRRASSDTGHFRAMKQAEMKLRELTNASRSAATTGALPSSCDLTVSPE
jgi:hypothetical protein